MRRIYNLVLFSVIVLAGCNSADESTTTSSDAESTNKDSGTPVMSEADLKAALPGCYSQVYERDTSSLQVANNNDSVAGPLVYKLFEKDRNDGLFKGRLDNDLLSGWYYFKSEGIMSVRQVAWKVRSGQLWPAMGEMKIRNDTMIFSDPGMLKYDSTHPFVKTGCN